MKNLNLGENHPWLEMKDKEIHQSENQWKQVCITGSHFPLCPPAVVNNERLARAVSPHLLVDLTISLGTAPYSHFPSAMPCYQWKEKELKRAKEFRLDMFFLLVAQGKLAASILGRTGWSSIYGTKKELKNLKMWLKNSIKTTYILAKGGFDAFFWIQRTDTGISLYKHNFYKAFWKRQVGFMNSSPNGSPSSSTE